jgi:serine phosphatase RsbU (regulator of sigma subunit)
MTGGPVRDEARLRAVAETGLTARTGEAAFDELAAAAAGLLEAPFAVFTVVDAERTWFAGAFGLPIDAERGRAVQDSFCKLVVGTGEPVIISDVRTDPRTADDPDLRAGAAVAWAGFPVRDAAGQVLGALGVVDERPRTWSTPQVEGLRVLARAAADQVQLRQALRAERHARADAEQAWIEAETARVDLQGARAREHQVIDVIQRSLLPRVLPDVPGLVTSVRFEVSNDAAGIGGDWYDVIRHDSEGTTFIIGDVCGHDVGAVAVMAQVRHYLHLLALQAAHPIDALAELDSLMLEQDFDRFATVAFLSWDAPSRELTYVSAGHPPPILVRADGSATFLEGGRRPPVNIGLVAPTVPDPGLVHLSSGDTVVLFTDGLFEAGGATFTDGLERLRRAASARAPGATGPAALCDQLLAAMRPASGWQDDVALLVARCP